MWPAASGDDGSYREDYEYNANGSITKLKRNGLASISSGQMDDLTYVYETVANGYTKNTNKLRQIQDAIASNIYADDINNQVQNNFTYDEIGNLTGDQFECIQNIEWTVYGKVKKVTRIPGCTPEGSPMPDLEFKYDAKENTIAKIVKPANQLGNPNEWTTTYYVRDASGNIMATYIQKPQNEGGQFVLEEYQLYGSTHLGTKQVEVAVNSIPTATSTYTRTLGKKQFFLSDHRGNNNVTVLDLKKPIESVTQPGTIAYFEPVIDRAVDYFPFGREMNGRFFNRNGSEFGYSGKQNIKEWSSRLGGPQLYDSRIKYDVIFITTDELFKDFPWNSPYAYAENRPIDGIDFEGKEFRSTGKTLNLQTGQVEIVYTVKIKVENASSLKDFNNTIHKIVSGAEGILANSKASGTIDDPIIKVNIINDKNATISVKVHDELPIVDQSGNTIGYKGGDSRGNSQNADINLSTKTPNAIRSEGAVSRSLAHELGHIVGLDHPFDINEKDKSAQTDIKQPLQPIPPAVNNAIKSNLLNSAANPVKALKDVSGKDLTKGQRETIEKTVQEEQPKK